MSNKLLILANRFLGREIASEDFVDEFMAQWKQERDNEMLLLDAEELSEALSSIFCFSDLFNPGEEREDYEFDEERLRLEIERALKIF